MQTRPMDDWSNNIMLMRFYCDIYLYFHVTSLYSHMYNNGMINFLVFVFHSRQVYNIVDDDPAPRMEVFMWAQNLVEQKFPGHVKQPTISPEREESLILDKVSRGYKRVSNARMKKELGVKLFHPNYRSGLLSIIDHMDNPYLQNSPGS